MSVWRAGFEPIWLEVVLEDHQELPHHHLSGDINSVGLVVSSVLKGNWALSRGPPFLSMQERADCAKPYKKSAGLWVNGHTVLKCILSSFLQV